MESIGSNESLNWFIEGEGEMDIGLNMQADDNNTAGNTDTGNGGHPQPQAFSSSNPSRQPQFKKRNGYSRGGSRRHGGSESPESEEAHQPQHSSSTAAPASRTKHTRKKYIKRTDLVSDMPHGSTSGSSSGGRAPGRVPGVGRASESMSVAVTGDFIESMKTSSSRLSRSLSSFKGTNSSVGSSSAPSSESQRRRDDDPYSSTLQRPLQGGPPAGTVCVSSGDESGTGQSTRSEAALVAEQKFKDKNREHARNTRSRKKQYIETLKQAFNELSAEREQLDRERSEALAKLAEQVTPFIYCSIVLWRRV